MSRAFGPLPLFLALALAGGTIALAWSPAAAQPAAYAVTITGVDDDGLRSLLATGSSLVQLQDKPPPGLSGLRRRADGDRERLEAVLHSEGYYDGHLDITLGGPGAAAGSTPPAAVTVAVTTGPPYRFGHVSVVTVPGDLLPALDPGTPGLLPGAVARAPLVVAAEARILHQLAESSFALAKVTGRRAEVDRQAKTMDVTFTVAPGPAVRLGTVRVSGLTQVDERLVRERAAWIAGELYRPELIERTRVSLTRLGVFASVSLRLADHADADGTHAVIVTVTERKRHTIGLGVTFTNAEGLGGQASWTHRNLFGGGEQLRLGAELARLNIRTLTAAGLDEADEKVTADLRKPGFLAPTQDLTLSTAVINEHPDAYQRQALTAGIRLERHLTDHLSVGYGLSGEQSEINDVDGFTNATLAGTPLSLAYDTTDVVLNPTIGYRLALESTPWLRLGDTGHSFVINRITQSAYQDLTGDGGLVAAGRLSIGSILNGSAADLPADKRFYAGGGGSVRGYAYQKVGPLDAAGHPLGGQSLAEASAEMRIKVTDTLGFVPFLDGGNVYSSLLPQPGQTLRFGTGLGIRYYTGFGPLRLDLGTPLQPTRTDQPIQVYLSMGQAF